jgi:hypothetical protein
MIQARLGSHIWRPHHESALKQRLVGAFLLRPATYAALKAEPGAWTETLLVVVAIAVSHGFGAILRAPSQGYSEAPSFTFLFGFTGEILLWIGMSASIFVGARLLHFRRVSFGELARPLGFAAAPGVGVIVAGALSGQGHVVVPLLVLMGAWRIAASYVAVREGLAVSGGNAAAWLAAGLLGGIGLVGAGTALLNHFGSM